MRLTLNRLRVRRSISSVRSHMSQYESSIAISDVSPDHVPGGMSPPCRPCAVPGSIRWMFLTPMGRFWLPVRSRRANPVKGACSVVIVDSPSACGRSSLVRCTGEPGRIRPLCGSSDWVGAFLEERDSLVHAELGVVGQTVVLHLEVVPHG